MDDFHCSFCGKRRREVRKLVSGPRVFICNECVVLCRAIIGPRPPTAEESEPPPPVTESADGPMLPQDARLRLREVTARENPAAVHAELAEFYGVPFTDLDALDIPEAVLSLVPGEIARKHLLVPITRSETRVTVAMIAPNTESAIDAVKQATGLEVERTVAGWSALIKRVEQHYPRPTGDAPYCSFCGKARREVTIMVAGPAVYMCNQCVDLAEDIVAEDLASNPPPP